MALQPYASPAERVWYYSFRAFCAAVFFFLIAPILVIMPLSFNAEPYFTYPMAGFSFRWYEDFFYSALWQDAIKNSCITAFSATFIAASLGTITALGLNRAQFPGKSFVLMILISPLVVPIVITAVAVFYLYAYVDLVFTYTGIIVAHAALGIPFVVITVTATLSGFDHNMIRAGASLGANPFRVFFKITLPLILPGIISGALFAFAISWDEVVVVLFLAGSEQHTIPRRMWSGIREKISPTITAAATLLVIVSVMLLVVVELLRRRSEKLRGIKR